MTNRIVLRTKEGDLIGTYDDFDDAITKLGSSFVMNGDYLLESETAGESNED